MNKITDVRMLQNAIVDLLDGSNNAGDNNTALSDADFVALLQMRDLIIAARNN